MKYLNKKVYVNTYYVLILIDFQILEEDVHKILAWEKHQGSVEIPFRPGRVILQDFTGVPAVVDFAAMRDAGKYFEYEFQN